jgi:hypothetical protein
MVLNPTNNAAPSTPIRAAVTGAQRTAPFTGGIWVRKHDLAVGDTYTELVSVKPNGLPRWELSRIVSIDKENGTMQISFGVNETKTAKPRDLSVTGGAKLEAANRDPPLVVVQGGRSVWVGGEAVRV